MLLANLDQPRQRRPLVGQQALAAFAAHAERGALAAEHFILGIEERVFLQPPPVQGRGAERKNPGPCLIGTSEAKFDLTLEWHRGQRKGAREGAFSGRSPSLFFSNGEELLLAASQHQDEGGAARRHRTQGTTGFLGGSYRLAIDARDDI